MVASLLSNAHVLQSLPFGIHTSRYLLEKEACYFVNSSHTLGRLDLCHRLRFIPAVDDPDGSSGDFEHGPPQAWRRTKTFAADSSD